MLMWWVGGQAIGARLAGIHAVRAGKARKQAVEGVILLNKEYDGFDLV